MSAIATHHHTSWRPLRVYSPSRDLGATVVHTYGYRGACDCGWQGRVRSTVALVRLDIREHRAQAPAG